MQAARGELPQAKRRGSTFFGIYKITENMAGYLSPLAYLEFSAFHFGPIAPALGAHSRHFLAPVFRFAHGFALSVPRPAFGPLLRHPDRLGPLTKRTARERRTYSVRLPAFAGGTLSPCRVSGDFFRRHRVAYRFGLSSRRR